MQTCSIKCNYSSNQAGVFLCKSSSRTMHNWHFIIGVLINASHLNVFLILHCHLFFRKEIFFFQIFIFKWIRMSLYVFRLRKGSSMKYVRNCWENGANHPKWVQLRIGGGVTLHVYVRTYTLSFHVFGIIFAI